MLKSNQRVNGDIKPTSFRAAGRAKGPLAATVRAGLISFGLEGINGRVVIVQGPEPSTTPVGTGELARPIVLVGLMGAGKTSVGRRLADDLGVAFADSDHAIEDAAGMSVADIFEVYGEAEFRALERRVIRRLLDDRSAGVVALGGGAFVDPETRALVLDHAHVVWLKADLDILVERTSRRPGKRPLLADRDPRAVLGALLREREPIYAMAHDTVVSGSEPVDRVVASVAATARRFGAPR